jgi:hypothetical protein
MKNSKQFERKTSRSYSGTIPDFASKDWQKPCKTLEQQVTGQDLNRKPPNIRLDQPVRSLESNKFEITKDYRILQNYEICKCRMRLSGQEVLRLWSDGIWEVPTFQRLLRTYSTSGTENGGRRFLRNIATVMSNFIASHKTVKAYLTTLPISTLYKAGRRAVHVWWWFRKDLEASGRDLLNPTETKRNHKNPSSGQQVSRPNTSRIEV